MKRRGSILGLLAAGIVVLIGAGFVTGSYWRGLLLNLGTGVLLFALLNQVLERLLNRVETVEKQAVESVDRLTQEVQEVQETAKATQARLDQVSEQTLQLLRQQHEVDEETLAAFEEAVTQETTAGLLRRADQLKCIGRSGVRVRIPGTNLRLRFRRATPAVEPGEEVGFAPGIVGLMATAFRKSLIWTQIENANGTVLEPLVWTENESAAEMMAKVAEALQQVGQYPGDTAFDTSGLMVQLKKTLALAIRSRTGHGGPHDLGQVIEVPNDEWAITSDGVQSLTHEYFIPKERLKENWPGQVATKAWVSIEKFEEAFFIACELLRT